jgi:hypothetical protein
MKCSPLELPLTIVFAVFTSPNLSDWAILKPATIPVSDLGEKPTAAFGLGRRGFWFSVFWSKSDGSDHEDRTKLGDTGGIKRARELQGWEHFYNSEHGA